MGGLAKLQGLHGNDLGGLLTGKFEAAGEIPPFAIMLDVVRVALAKGEKMGDAEAEDLADDMLTQDRTLCGAVMQAAFPTSDKPGNGKAPKAKG